MKKLRSRSLIGLLSVFLFASGCSADGNQAGIQDLEAIQNTLRHIPEEQTVSGIQNALSDLVARTAQVNGYSYQLATSFSIDGFLEPKNGNVSHKTDKNVSNSLDTQESLQSYLYKNGTLYEVLRYSASAASAPYIGIIRINKESTLQLNCIPASDEVSVFADDPLLILDYTLNDQNRLLKDADAKEVENALLSEEYNSLAALFSLADPACYQFPDDYEFLFDESGQRPILQIRLKDPKSSTRDQILQEQTIQVYLDASTYAMVRVDSYALLVNNDGTQSKRSSSTVIEPVASAQEFGFLDDLFKQIEDKSINMKDTFTLEMKAEDPAKILEENPE
ncbi:hypothetical protein [Ileibacterium valens]|uniref:hypothetical protein n=1 Tax=Ileibacterium valens TaxID=1862668 RepID=UPI002573FD2B|nr:hypothetical protein [Ileibacterium valens]